MDKKGTHTIQSMLDVMTMPEEEELVADDLKGHIFELASVSLFLLCVTTCQQRTNKQLMWYKKPCLHLRSLGNNSFSQKAWPG